MHQVFNYAEVEKCTDLIANILNILQYIKRSKLFEIDEVINANYRLCVINVNLEMYFDKEFSGWDKIIRVYKTQIREYIERSIKNI